MHVVAQRGMFGGELDVVALHGARHSTVNALGIEHRPPRLESCTYERTRIPVIASVSACCLSPARPSCLPARGCSARRCTSAACGFELLVTVRALLAMPLFAWFALRPIAAGAMPPRRAATARGRVRRRARRHRLLLHRRAGGFLGADAHRRLDRTRAAVQLSGAGGADQFDHAAARARSARGARACWSPTRASSSPWAASTSPSCAQNLFGALLVLIAALTTAIYFLIGERYTQELGATRFAAIAMSSSARGAGDPLRAVPLGRRAGAAAGARLAAARRPGDRLHVPARSHAGRRGAPRRRAARCHRQHRRSAGHHRAGGAVPRRAPQRLAAARQRHDRGQRLATQSRQTRPERP